MSRKPDVLTLTLLLLTVPAVFGAARASRYPLEQQLWRDVDGEILPFQTPGEIEDYLRNARILSAETTREGTTRPKKALLERNSLRVHACFRHVRVHQKRMRFENGDVRFNFRDDAIFEVAAYELAKLLGFHNVPPTVLREVKGKQVTLQIWVSSTITEKHRLDRDLRPTSQWHWIAQNRLVTLFDNLIYNEDRNMGNLLYDEEWRVWMIDHTRAFRIDDELPDPMMVSGCERTIWERLTTLPDEAFYEALGPYLGKSQIETLLQRKVKLVRRLANRMELYGEAQVLFTLWVSPSQAVQ